MDRPLAFYLNFDSDNELANPSYSRSPLMATRCLALRSKLQNLLRPFDIIIEDSTRSLNKLHALAWCPTPLALRAITKANATPPLAPPLSVLRKVNGRRFCAELGQPLPLSYYLSSLTQFQNILSTPPQHTEYLLKREFGFAGKGQRRINLACISTQDFAFLNASIAKFDGIQLEPLVNRTDDFAIHGFISQNGSVTIGQPTRQAIDSNGVWQQSMLATTDWLSHTEQAALVGEARVVAEALKTQGYFGPFGLDAFRYLDDNGIPQFNPRCEINARYSMGWAIGMNNRRPDLEF